MKRLILTGLLIGSVIFAAEAQKVYKDSEMFVIECAGMPAGAYTKSPKPRSTDGTNATMGSNTETNIGSDVNNKKVAYRFEVAATDNSTSSDWLTAVNLCAGLSSGSWRLPTQRELQLIWIQHEKLKSLSGFTSFNLKVYWGSTERNASNCSIVSFNDGSANSNGKTINNNVRCVRDF